MHVCMYWLAIRAPPSSLMLPGYPPPPSVSGDRTVAAGDRLGRTTGEPLARRLQCMRQLAEQSRRGDEVARARRDLELRGDARHERGADRRAGAPELVCRVADGV